MCTIVNKNQLPRTLFQRIFRITPEIKPFIAKKDIICYKRYIKTDIVGTVLSPYMKTFHLIGKPQPKVEIRYDSRGDTLWVEEGYHSVNSLMNSEFHFMVNENIIMECIIPKGSEYYIGNHYGVGDGYVSNQLIIIKLILI